MNYRPEIDGLRAFAVVFVVLYHLGVPGFSGGFIGVDVFFVISGYLITSLIRREVSEGRFTLSGFYFRRVRRLIPALLATVGLTFIGAAFVLQPLGFESFARSAVAAIFSFSNIVFYLESGYWDTASEFKPLLHTWSLGVEEQFYLLWPLLLLGIFALHRRIHSGVVFFILFISGSALCIWYTAVDVAGAFYLLPFRVFQFALGAMLIPVVDQWRDNPPGRFLISLVFLCGVGLVLAGVLVFNQQTVFPGAAALVPSIGAGLVIVATAGGSTLHAGFKALLGNALCVRIGLMSYSIYLVHWPLISLYRYQVGGELEIQDQFQIVAGIVLLSLLLHHGVERRFYQRRTANLSATVGSIRPFRFVAVTLICAVGLSVVAGSAWLGDGWPWRYPGAVLSKEQIVAGQVDRFTNYRTACRASYISRHESCRPRAGTQILVIGNSHEIDGYNFLNAVYGENPDVQLYTFGRTYKCGKIEPKAGKMVAGNERCQARLDSIFENEFVEHLDVVFYSALGPYGPKKLKVLHIFEQLKARNPDIKVVTLGGYFSTKWGCAIHINKYKTSKACLWPENLVNFWDKPEEGQLYESFRAVEDYYIDRVGLLCEDRKIENCLTETPAGIPAMYDKHHHSREFAEYSARLYAQKYPDLFRELASTGKE